MTLLLRRCTVTISLNSWKVYSSDTSSPLTLRLHCISGMLCSAFRDPLLLILFTSSSIWIDGRRKSVLSVSKSISGFPSLALNDDVKVISVISAVFKYSNGFQKCCLVLTLFIAKMIQKNVTQTWMDIIIIGICWLFLEEWSLSVPNSEHLLMTKIWCTCMWYNVG